MRFALILASLFITAPASAQTYDYTARTEAPVRQSGEVRAGALTWRCSGQVCTISGPWPTPGEGACAALASQVGRISEYGHPGRRLDAAALGRCNRNVAAAPMLQVRPEVLTPRTMTPTVPLQPVQRPAQQQMQAATAMNYTAPRITRQTLAVEPRPTGRLWAVRTGGGDGDFGGNGPNVSLGAEVYARDHCLRARINMTARENRSDWTEGAVAEDIEIWCNPDGGAIERILDETRATAAYADTDWEIDTVVPGLGEVDPRRSFPVPDGPVRAFMVMGDTTGDVFSNNDDGRDVEYLDAEGRFQVQRTSVQVQFNPIRVVTPFSAPPPPPSGPPGSHTLVLQGQHSAYHVLRHTNGDRDFFGQGPRMSVASTLSLSPDGRRILASLDGSAEETRGDRTRAEGRFAGETVWTAPAGWRIASVEVRQDWPDPEGVWHASTETALGRRAAASYVDTDHEHDFLVEGVGEAARDPGWSIGFAPIVRQRRGEARSHVQAFQVIGDTNGDEAGTRTGVRAFYAPLTVTLTPTSPSARASDFDPDVFLNVPTGDFVNRLSGGNSCGPQAGSRLLRFYGVPTTYEQFKRRVQSSGNAVSDQSLGTPPGTLRDRMNELAPGFVHEVLPLENATRNAAALQRIRDLLDAGRPVIVLVSWGNQLADGIISPHDAAATSHWIVVRGYDSRARTFHVVDNGHGEQWSYAYMESMMDYGQDAQYEALLAMFNVQKGSIIYRR